MTIKLEAATRLKAAYSPSEATKKDFIHRFMQKCKCDEATARHYLTDEEWIFDDAVHFYEADKKQGLHASYAQSGEARKYIESVAGIKVGKLKGTMHGIINFSIPAKVVPNVVARLNKRFGTYSPGEASYIAYEWEVAKGRYIRVLKFGSKFGISLFDAEARKDIHVPGK